MFGDGDDLSGGRVIDQFGQVVFGFPKWNGDHDVPPIFWLNIAKICHGSKDEQTAGRVFMCPAAVTACTTYCG
ncbi:hypothetical protein D3C80_2076510 [compost metagenome]